jgi:hypothetical protein
LCQNHPNNWRKYFQLFNIGLWFCAIVESAPLGQTCAKNFLWCYATYISCLNCQVHLYKLAVTFLCNSGKCTTHQHVATDPHFGIFLGNFEVVFMYESQLAVAR